METKKQTSYPSIDKPWLKYYSEEAINAAENPVKCSLYQYLLTSNKTHLNRIALEYYGTKITYGKLLEQIDSLAECFRAYGIAFGDAVTICLPNVPEIVIAIYALNKIGAIASLIDPRVNSERILEHTNKVNSKLLIVIRDICQERISPIADKLTVEKILVVSAADSTKSMIVHARYIIPFKKSATNKYVIMKDFIQQYIKEVSLQPIYKEKSSAVIVFTSGTTGTSKGVVLSNEGIIASSRQLCLCLNSDRARRFLAIIPFSVAYGFVDGMNTALNNGMTLTLVPKYKPRNFTKLVLKHKPNVVIAVPKFWEDMAYYLEKKKADISFLVYPISGGDKIPNASVKNVNHCFRNHHSDAKLLIGYGATEFGAAISLTIPNGAYENGSVGEPMPIAMVKILDPKTNQELPDGQDGEIIFNSQSMMLGYYNQPEETQNITYIDSNGVRYYRTGDKGHLSSNGSLYIVDRYKRVMMRPDGHTVHATSIENVLMDTGMIRSCAVVGLKIDGRAGVIPTAYIVLNENVDNSHKTIRTLDNISLQKLPDRDRALAYIVVDKLPYTMNGKVDFRLLESVTIDKARANIVDYSFINKRGERI